MYDPTTLVKNLFELSLSPAWDTYLFIYIKKSLQFKRHLFISFCLDSFSILFVLCMGPFYICIFFTPRTMMLLFGFMVPIEHVSFGHLPQIIHNGGIFFRYFMSFWLFEGQAKKPGLGLCQTPKEQKHQYSRDTYRSTGIPPMHDSHTEGTPPDPKIENHLYK